MVEHLFCKQAVAGSNPIAGSSFLPSQTLLHLPPMRTEADRPVADQAARHIILRAPIAQSAPTAQIVPLPLRQRKRRDVGAVRPRYGARLKEEAAPVEEAEAPVGPLGRATEAGKLLMSTAEVKALPSTKVVELPARPSNEQLVRASRAPFTKTGIYEYEQRQAEAKEGLRKPLAEMRKKDAVDELRQLFAQERKDAAVENLREPLLRMSLAESRRDAATAGLQRDFLKEENAEATSKVGRSIRQANGNEQTGAAAGTVAASIPPIATGTPMNAPAMPTVQGVERGNKQMVENVLPNFGKMEFTPKELAEMNAPETNAQRKARVMREMRSKLGETPATAPIP